MTSGNKVADAIKSTLESVNESDRNMEPANVVDGLFAIARGLNAVATAIRYLGNGDSNDPRGAVEFLSTEVKSGLDNIAVAIEGSRRDGQPSVPTV